MSRAQKIWLDVWEGFIAACLVIAIVGRAFFADSPFVELATGGALGASLVFVFQMRYYRSKKLLYGDALEGNLFALESMSRVVAILAKRLNPKGHVDIPREEIEQTETKDMQVFMEEEGVRILVR